MNNNTWKETIETGYGRFESIYYNYNYKNQNEYVSK